MGSNDIALLSIFLGSICSFGSLLLGLGGLIFGIYTHFSTRKTANLQYSVTQLTDYDLPEGITTSLRLIPFAIEIKSIGNKQVENIRVRLITASKLDEVKVMASETHQENLDEKTANISLQVLNPGETIKIRGQCTKLANIKNYVETLEITHSEGVAVKTS